MGAPVRFGLFEVDLGSRELRKRGIRLHLPDQSFEILAMLVERPGELITREQIRDRLWPHGTVVEFEHSVNSAVKRLRDRLGDSATAPRFIETLPRRGYRFVAPVETGVSTPSSPHFRVLGELGHGGMGVVYKADDLILGRTVALKFLPEDLARHPPSVERFRREARTVASLNHPGICALYGVEEHEGRLCLVMEYLEGQPLNRLMEGGPLTLKRALRIAAQASEALAAAHSAGIVHRDITPANIFVTGSGQVKILDFGLAEVSRQDAAMCDASPKAVRTEDDHTEWVAVDGTTAYLSPEQVRGEAVDARSDIFSLGSVLYEMVTGQKAFQGTGKMSTLSAILHQEPKPVSGITPAIPADLEELINRCLRRDPARRFQHMDDVKVALDELKEELDPGRAAAIEGAAKIASPHTGGIQAGKRRWILAFAALLAVCLLGVGVVWFVKRGVVPPPELTQRRLTMNSSENPVFSGITSPDGKYVAYSDATGIHLKLIETNEERVLAQPSGIASDATWNVMAWFPDGSRLLANLWEAGGRPSVWVVAVIAESARRLRDDTIGWSVSPDGAHIAYTTGSGQNYYQEIGIMNPQGEGAEKILSVGENNWVYALQWSPDSQRLAYVKNHLAQERFERSIETCTLKDTDPTVVVADPMLSSFCWAPQGYIIYARRDSVPTDSGNLWKIPLNSRTGKAESRPARLTNWAGFYVDGLAVSADGKRMTYIRSTEQIQVYVGELEAGGTSLKSPRRLTLDEQGYFSIGGWMRDSEGILFTSNRGGSNAIYKQAVDGGAAQVVVSSSPGSFIDEARVSPDGSWLLYTVNQEEDYTSILFRIMRMPIDGGPSQFVLEGKNSPNPWFLCTMAPATFCAVGELSQDRKLLTITSFDPLKGRGRILKTIETDPTASYDWRLSPDGSRLAFTRRGEREAHIRLFSLAGGKDQEITVKGWGNLQATGYSADGKAFYSSSTSPEAATLLRIDMEGRVRVLWRQKGPSVIWGVPSPDGQHLAIPALFPNSNLWMVEDF